ncbi:MAG TPA: TetR/AcrR family transcriptional regulator [Chthoniobacterales bacterium]|nr:TetR/AcrR family transcriptional regulator [Chthoniobacterales bacterium]
MEPSHRPYHHGNLRQALLLAAEAALEKNGVANLSLRELSRMVGVSHTSPRRHFADKQALLDALAQNGFQRFDAALARASESRSRDFTTRLTKTAQAYVDFALKHPALWTLMFEAKHRPGAPPDLLAASDAAFSRLATILRSGQESGEIIPGDPGQLSLTFHTALVGLVWVSTKGKFKGVPLHELVPLMIKHILVGLRPRAQ